MRKRRDVELIDLDNRLTVTIQRTADVLALHLAPRTRAYHEIWLNGEKVEEHRASSEERGPPQPPAPCSYSASSRTQILR